MVFNILFFTMFFWIFIDIMPGLEAPQGIFGNFITAVLFGIIYYSLPSILKFFKFPVNFSGKFLVGTLLVMLMLLLLSALLPSVLTITPGYVGGGDFIFFTMPKIFELPTSFAVLVFSSAVSVLCSIILEKYGK
ncbi:MAG TPA: hypothetical protein VJC17_03505 [Candidatus Dojkabacteria bacterium]|nr:hypothetical protein [Candidatus Dojkabacteria bacterium]